MICGIDQNLRHFQSEHLVHAMSQKQPELSVRNCRFLRPTAIMMDTWGCSSAGRASDLHSEGQGFESPQLHFVNLERTPTISAAVLP